VKTDLNDIYNVAIAITRANEGYIGWNSFLIHLKKCMLSFGSGASNANSQQICIRHIISDRDKDVVQALKDTFPRNHSTQWMIHIQCNVLTKCHCHTAATQAGKISKTFSYYQEQKMLPIGQ
jgi:hypothetical protein